MKLASLSIGQWIVADCIQFQLTSPYSGKKYLNIRRGIYYIEPKLNTAINRFTR